MFRWFEDGLFGAFCRAYQRFRQALMAGELDVDEPPAIDVEPEPAPKKPRKASK
jgi:hypothetical protein